MSVYGAFTQLATSGLSLVDDQAYLIPYNKALSFQIGWKGRLKQIAELQQIVEVNQPQVVYKSDDFDYTLAPETKILKHNRERNRNHEIDELSHVYIIYTTKTGVKFMIMEAYEVNRTRDLYSQSYKKYKSNDGKWTDGNAMDLPFALSNPEKYFKKTLVKRLYDELPKPQKMTDLDVSIKNNPDGDDVQDIPHSVETPVPGEKFDTIEPEIVTPQTEPTELPFDKDKSGQEF